MDHGVSVKFIKEVESLGYGHPPLEQLVRMVDHGVTAKFINELKEIGVSESADRATGPHAGPRSHTGIH